MGGEGGYICTECGKIVAGKVVVLLLLVVGRGFLGVCVCVCVCRGERVVVLPLCAFGINHLQTDFGHVVARV